jgi:ATP-dependent exoDNAse (exonuclease V) beta subunit
MSKIIYPILVHFGLKTYTLLKTQTMINSTKQLNEIIRNFSKENANSSISQLRAIILTCKNVGIRFSSDPNYEETILSFTKENFPEFVLQKANQEIESLAKQNKYQEAAEMRDKIISINNEIHRQLRLKKYGTTDWFIAKSVTEIFFLPTQISGVDSLIFEMNN